MSYWLSMTKPLCNDPRHDEDCDCGARPDAQYERRREQRMEEL